MQCGFYENEITPALGMNLPGYFFIRPAEGVMDRLYARAFVIRNIDGAFAIISVDCLYITKAMTDAVRDRIFKAVGIPHENILLCATHTHTGGPLLGTATDNMDAPRPYAEYLCIKAADAAILAYNACVPAKIGFGSGNEKEISFIRRYIMSDGKVRTNPGFHNNDIIRPASEIDPEVSVIRVDDLSGNVMGVITNFACHCDTIGGTYFSADYPGELHRTLKKVYGEGIVSIFLAGACGNIAHVDYMHGDAAWYSNKDKWHYVTMGRILAGNVIQTLEKITTTSEDLKIRMKEFSIQGGVRKPTEEDVKKAHSYLSEKPFKEYRIYDYDNPWTLVDSYFARDVIELHKSADRFVTLTMQVLRIGEAVLAGLPCELFVEFGLDIKRRAGYKHVLIATLSNDNQGYVATREAFIQGGYEVRLNKTTKLDQETGYRMVDAVIEQIQKL